MGRSLLAIIIGIHALVFTPSTNLYASQSLETKQSQETKAFNENCIKDFDAIFCALGGDVSPHEKLNKAVRDHSGCSSGLYYRFVDLQIIILDYVSDILPKSKYYEMQAYHKNKFFNSNNYPRLLLPLSDGTLATAHYAVHCWDPNNLTKEYFCSKTYQNRISAITELPNQKIAVCLEGPYSKKKNSGVNNNIEIFDLQNIKQKQPSIIIELDHDSTIAFLGLLSDKQTLVTGSTRGIDLWNTDEKKSKKIITYYKDDRLSTTANSVAILPHNDIAFVIDQVIHIVDSRDSTKKTSLPIKTGKTPQLILFNNEKLISTSAHSNPNDPSTSCFNSYNLKMPPETQQVEFNNCYSSQHFICQLDNKLLAGANSYWNKVFIWDPNEPTKKTFIWSRESKKEYDFICQIACLKDGRIVTTSDEGYITVWDTSLAAVVRSIMNKRNSKEVESENKKTDSQCTIQ